MAQWLLLWHRHTEYIEHHKRLRRSLAKKVGAAVLARTTSHSLNSCSSRTRSLCPAFLRRACAALSWVWMSSVSFAPASVRRSDAYPDFLSAQHAIENQMFC